MIDLKRIRSSREPALVIGAENSRMALTASQNLDARKRSSRPARYRTPILNSAYFSSIATDEKGVIQIFNAGAERMLGFAALDVVNPDHTC